MGHAVRAACLVLSLLWVQAAVAEPTVRDLAARTEVHPIQTLTVSVRQFLTGDQDGKPVTIAGHLRFPQAVVGRLPAVILQHGSSGSNARDELWAKTFNEMAIATFLVDSFSGRGLVRTSTNPGQFNSYSVILDAYRALNVLANHSRIDPARIAIMGFSLGADDYTPVAPCRAYLERLRAAVLTEYPDAHHSFDNPLKDPCLQTDAHTGYNEAAASAARIAVKDFVRTLFKLER